MNKRTKELSAISGMVLGLGIAIGPAVIAYEAWNASEIQSTDANSDTLTDIGNMAYIFDLGGLALAVGSGIALRRIDRSE